MKTLKRTLCLMLSIIMALSCLSVAAAAVEGDKFTSTLKTATTVTNKESAKLTLDEIDKILASQNNGEGIYFPLVESLNINVDLRDVNGLCSTLDLLKRALEVDNALDYLTTKAIKAALGQFGDDINLKNWPTGMKRTGDDIAILRGLLGFMGDNNKVVSGILKGNYDMGVINNFIDINELLGPDGISRLLKEAIIGALYDTGSDEFTAAYNTYKDDMDAFIYGKLLPSFIEGTLPGLTISSTSTIDSLLIDIYNICLEKYIKPELMELNIDISNSTIPELKALSGVLNLKGSTYDYSTLTYSHDKTLKQQINTVIGAYVKNIMPAYDGWAAGGYDVFNTNIENAVKYIASVSGIKGDTLEEIGIETTLLIIKNNDFGEFEAGLENCTTPEELAAAFLINAANDIGIGVSYTGNESYLVVAGDILASWAYDNFAFTDYNGKAYRPGGGKDVFEVANYLANYFLFDRAGAGVLGLSVTKTESVFSKIDKIADYFGETKAKGVNFDSESFFNGLIDGMFTLDIGALIELTIIPILDNAGPVRAEEFIYKSVQYFLNNWANRTLFPAYQSKAFTNALSNTSIGNMAEALLAMISERKTDFVTLLTFVAAVMLKTDTTEYAVDATMQNFTATGKAITPKATVKANGKTLTENTDYIILADKAVTPGTYKATVKGIGLYSGEFEKSFTVSMPAVSSISYSSPTTSSVKLSWNKPLYADSYTVSIYDSSKKNYKEIASGITSTSYTVKGLDAGKEYKLRVQAVSSVYGKSEAKEITAYTVPSAVTKLTATPTASSVKLSWSAVTGATHYKIESYSSKKWKSVTTTSKTSYTISDLSDYTSYTYRVTALKKLSDGTYLAASPVEIKTKTLLGTTSSLKTSATSSTITLTWSKVNGAEKYEVLQYKNSKWEPVGTTTKTTYKISKLSAGTQYKFRVRAVVGKSTYGSAKEASAYTLPAAVSSSKLKATATASSIKLSWSAVSSATHYKIERYSSKKWKTVTTTSKTSYTIIGLSSYTSYTYRVTALKKLSDGTYLAASPVEIKAKTLLGTTSSLKSSATSSTMTLTWSKVSGAEKYQVRQYTGGKWKTVATTSKTTYKVSKLKANTKYKFSVRAVVGKSTYGSAKEISAYTLLATPTKVKVSSTTATTAKLTWSKVSGASSYEVYAYLSGKWTKVATSKKTSATVKELPSGTKTKLKVRAVSKNVKSAFSSEVSALTLVAKVSSLKTSQRKTNSITLTWKKTTGATSYEIYRYTNGKWKKIGTTKSTSYTDSKSLSKGTEYQYKVRAVQKVSKKTTRYGDYSSVLKAKTTIIGSSRF